MENSPQQSIPHHWRFSPKDDSIPIHSFTQHMSLRRFEALFRRLHIFHEGDLLPSAFNSNISGLKLKAYRQVERWSQHI